MSMLTTWGYTIKNIDSLLSILQAYEFNVFTANKYEDDDRAESNLAAASMSVRNYCGWHVYPEALCEFDTTLFDYRVTEFRGGLLIQLPAAFVINVSKVVIGNTEYDTYVFEHSGLLRVYGINRTLMPRFTKILVEYCAGIPEDMAAAIKELVAHRVTHALASSSGVQSETAGGVSVTYNASWVNGSRATALADDNKEVLQPYRIQGVF